MDIFRCCFIVQSQQQTWMRKLQVFWHDKKPLAGNASMGIQSQSNIHMNARAEHYIVKI